MQTQRTGRVALALLVIGLLGFLQTAYAGNFSVTVCKKDGTVATDLSTLVVKDSTGAVITPTNYNFLNGTHTFTIAPAGVGGNKSVEFTITRGSATTSTKGYWSNSPKNPSTVLIVVDN